MIKYNLEVCIKKLICFITCLLIILLTVPVSVFADESSAADQFPMVKNDTGVYVAVIQRRLYDLGYIHFRPTGKYADLTVSAVRNFQSRNGLSATGELTYDTYLKLFTADLRRAAGNSNMPVIFGKGQIITTKAGDLYDWTKIVSPAFPVGEKAVVTDYNTGLRFTVQRTGGTNHADVQPVNAESAANMLSAFGGGVSWEKRAVIVEIGDMRIAGSLFGYPNKNNVLKNGHSQGSYCLHFSGSKSDIGPGLPDTEHDEKCLRANGQ